MNGNSPIENSMNNQETYQDDYHFNFDYQGLNIHAFCSERSGQSTVTVNDKLASKKKAWFPKSRHVFELNGEKFEVEFYLKSMFSGERHCTLIHNGVHVKTEKLLKADQLQPRQLIGILAAFAFMGGIMLGYYLARQFLFGQG